jgi:hypothetical protein
VYTAAATTVAALTAGCQHVQEAPQHRVAHQLPQRELRAVGQLEDLFSFWFDFKWGFE